MEVHHHSHHGKKKWTEYFWEFLMLFLAVFCGFLAENFREHTIEQRREKKYIQSMIEDLKTDTVYFSSETAGRKQNRYMVDTLIHLLSQKTRSEFEQQHMYYLARVCISRVELPQINDRTYDQMKSSGNLRLIHKDKIADSISRYYFNAKEIQVNINQTQMRILNTIEAEGKVFDGQVFQQLTDMDNFVFKNPEGNPSLVTGDKEKINELIVKLHYLISISAFTELYFKSMNVQAGRLISFLQNEYHID
jgi:hypothetical protein